MSHMDKAELQSVFLANRDRLHHFLRARALDDSEAEDCLQEIWLRILGARVGTIKEPLSYLYRMADNMVIDLRRGARRRADRERAWASRIPGVPEDIDPYPGADEAITARERLAAVQSAIAPLPARTREIFRKFRLEGISQKEIASEFGITVSAVEKQLQKAYAAVLQAASEFDN